MANQYKKNFLTNVIVRADFFNPITQIDEEVPVDIAKKILVNFPISEPTEIIGAELQISPGGIENKQHKIKEWNFYGKRKEKLLNISKDHLLMDFNEYESFDKYVQHYLPVLDELFVHYKDLQITRLGLRYIDNIELQTGDPLNWKGYINKNMLSIFDVPQDKSKIARAFQILDLNYNQFNIRFQYGMHNPDFPAPIKKKIFVIDTDAYCQGLLNKDDAYDLLNGLHKEIRILFENAITQKMRDYFNE